MLRNVLFKLPYSIVNTKQYLPKPSLLHLPWKLTTNRNYTQFVKNKERYDLRSKWNTIPTRNASRKDALIENFYKNVYRGFAVIATSTLVFIKLIGMKLLLLQLTPILFLFRNQVPMITQHFRRDAKLLYKYFKTLSVYNTYENKDMTLYKSFKEVATKYPNDIMFHFDDQKWTYKEVITLVDKLSLYFHKKGFDKGDVVVVFMSNRPDYIALILAFSKIGTIACLINTHLKLKMLLKRIEGIKCKALVVSRDFISTVEGIKEALVAQKIKLYLYDGPVQDKAFVNLRDELAQLKDEPLNLQYKVTFHDKILYTFAGNPVGYSSHSAISNAKFIFTALSATEFLEAKKGKDVVYSILPFYKAENLATALGPTIVIGVKAVIKKKFSAADYFKDCKLHNCTLAQYGSEVGKHLSAYKHTKFDKTHNVRYMFGQGMHHNIWEYVQDRFNVRIIQYYGTSNNIHLVNINFHRGAVGYLPKILPPIFHPYQIVRVLWHDVMAPVRTQGGACDRVDNYETGMLVGLITQRPDSQFRKCQILDKDGKAKNVVYNVVRKGDKGFLSGDLFLRDRFGYLYYQGLAGDNFRWQAENISVQEVESILKETTGISFLVYYGVKVPNTVDRVGMLLITEDVKKFDLDAFLKTAKEHLPIYAIPTFLRFTTNIDLKPVKTVDRIKYQDQSFDPEKIKDKLFYWNKKTDKYEVLTKAIYADIAVDKILL